MKCKKIFDLINQEDGYRKTIFLTSKFNYFDRKEDWFIVKVERVLGREVREEKKINEKLGKMLWERY